MIGGAEKVNKELFVKIKKRQLRNIKKEEKSVILVDVEVPAIQQVFDFELDDNASVGEVMKQMVRLITEKEGLKETDAEKMLLYACKHEKILNTDMSFKEQGVWAGQRLMLI